MTRNEERITAGRLGRPQSMPRSTEATTARHPSRQWSWIVLGVLLVAGSALAFGLFSQRADDAKDVLALRRDVEVGHVLSRGDLRVVQLVADATLPTVPAAASSAVVGRPMALPVAAGSLLTPRALGAARRIGAGHAVVGLALEAGQFPAQLSAGDRVRVVDLGDSAAGRGAVAARLATVLSTSPSGSSPEGSIVALLVSDDEADVVAVLAGAGRAGLVVVAPGS